MSIYLNQLVSFRPHESVPAAYDIDFLSKGGEQPVPVAQIRAVLGYLVGATIRHANRSTKREALIECRRLIKCFESIEADCWRVKKSWWQRKEDVETAMQILDSLLECGLLLCRKIEETCRRPGLPEVSELGASMRNIVEDPNIDLV